MTPEERVKQAFRGSSDDWRTRRELVYRLFGEEAQRELAARELSYDVARNARWNLGGGS